MGQTPTSALRVPAAMKALEDYVAGKAEAFSKEDAAVILESSQRMSGAIMKQIQVIAMMTQMMPQVELATDAAHRAVSNMNAKLAEAFMSKQPSTPAEKG